MAEKIFVELDEEIIFTAEKIRQVDNKRVILVVPEKAALLGSIVSLKLLAQEISKVDKTVVLVTKDEIGIRLAKKAQFVVVKKVGKITDDQWDKARELREKLVEKRENDRKRFLKERQEQLRSTGKKQIDTEDEIDKHVKPSSGIPIGGTVAGLKPKTVDIDGFKMVAGGDIAEMRNEEERIEKESANKEQATEDEIDTKRDSLKGKTAQAGLVGRDLSSFAYSSIPEQKPEKKPRKRTFDIGGQINSIKTAISSFFSEGGAKQKVLIGIVLLLIIFFALSYFVLPKGVVNLQVESQDIEISEEVIADTAIAALDIETLNIPAQQLEVVKDRSDSASASGVKETGEHASGQITIFNLTESQVTVPADTLLESVETGLKYKIVADVTISAKKPDDDPVSPGLIGNEDVGVVADDFGEEYNVQTKQEYQVSGFDVENLYGKNFNNITGGTTEEKTVVSQEDYDALKGSLVEQLEADLKESLKSEAGVEKELLEDTIKYEIINEDATPGVNAETDTFNLSITIKAVGLSFDKEDIDNLAETLVFSENEQEVDIEEFEYSSEVINTEGSKITIKLDITGIVTPSIDQEEIKNAMSGKNKNQAEEYLNNKEEIDNYNIELWPPWLPSFLRHFPSSTQRIEVRIEKK